MFYDAKSQRQWIVCLPNLNWKNPNASSTFPSAFIPNVWEATGPTYLVLLTPNTRVGWGLIGGAGIQYIHCVFVDVLLVWYRLSSRTIFKEAVDQWGGWLSSRIWEDLLGSERNKLKRQWFRQYIARSFLLWITLPRSMTLLPWDNCTYLVYSISYKDSFVFPFVGRSGFSYISNAPITRVEAESG